jgi:hypothetical protein
MSYAAQVVAFALSLSVVFTTSPLAAQDTDQINPGDRTIGVWVGASFYAPSTVFLGHTPDRHLFLVGARGEWALRTVRSFTLMATVDVLPFAMVTNNPTYRVVEYKPTANETTTIKERTGSAPVYGAGLSPIGLELLGPRVGAARLYVAAAGGGLWFTRETPEPNARRFNFTLEYGFGLRVPLRSGSSMTVGYKYHHLSNAWTAPRNPGLDGNVIYLGLVHSR